MTSEAKKDGGPAFPGEGAITIRHPEGGDETSTAWFSGMTLRDWFAGQALASGMAINRCYPAADAMLAEREKETDE